VRSNATKLTVYFSERQRTGDAYLADALLNLYERHGVHTSVLLRGVDGVGAHHHLHTDRLLSSSENLPAVSIAVDSEERMQAALADVEPLTEAGGLITLERATLVSVDELETTGIGTTEVGATGIGATEIGGDADAPVKLTLFGGRSVRADGQAGYVTAVSRLAAAQVAGASVLLAVDGTLHGQRRRARFFARNADVPLMLSAVGPAASLGRALPELAGLLDEPVAIIERVEVCKADGRLLSTPSSPTKTDPTVRPDGLKITVHVEEGATHQGRPVHSELLQRLHHSAVAGVTVLRGVRGFYGQRTPFADRAWSVRRNVPVLLEAIDTPARVRDWWPVVDELTTEHGLVTSELLPASFTAR
jgi:PII-like signaling protein